MVALAPSTRTRNKIAAGSSSSSSSSTSQSSSSSSGGGGSITQYAYGLRYVDDLVCRDATPDGGSTTRIYYLSDRQFNVVAIADTSGGVLERYSYTPYGQRTVLTDAFVVKTSGSSYSSASGGCGFQGLLLDIESDLIENRNRVLHPTLGRFLQRDPLGYPDGLNAYAASHVMRDGVDPTGLAYFSYRPLGGALGYLGVGDSWLDNWANIVIGHEHLFFEDGMTCPHFMYQCL